MRGERLRVGETTARRRRSSPPRASSSAPVANSRSTPCARANAPISACASGAKSPSSAMSPSTSHLACRRAGQHLDAGAHRARVGVVGVVDEPGAAERRLELQPPGTGAHRARGPRRCARASRPRPRRPPQPRARSTTLWRPPSAARRRRCPSGHTSVKRVMKPCGADRRAHVVGAEIRGRSHAEGHDPRARQAAPQVGELVVRVDDRGGRRAPGPRPSRLRRAPRPRGCRSLRDAPRRRW